MTGKVSLEDMNAVRDVSARYNWAFDSGDADAYTALFTPDGSLIGAGPQPATGKEALSAVVAGSFAHFKGGVRHHMTDLVADYGADKNTINAKGVVLVTNWADGGKLFALALAHIVLVKAGSDWKIKSNTLTMKLA